MKKTLLKSAVMAVVGVGLMAGSAMADPLPFLSGGISLSGGYKLTGGTGSISDATGIDFSPSAIVTDVAGSFDVLTTFDQNNTAFDVAAMTDFVFAPLAINGTPLWFIDDRDSAAEFSFYLNMLTLIDRGVTTADTLIIKGTGILSGTSYENTPGTWTFTANTGGGTFSWSSSNAPVPEPATMLLFGTGLAGLAGIARRRKK